MKSPRLLTVSLATAVLAISNGGSAQDRPPQTGDSILGRWDASTVINAGKVSNWDNEVLIENDRLEFTRKGKEAEGQKWQITVDDSKRPSRITMTGTSGFPKKIHAIYSKQAKEIRIAFLPGLNGSSLEDWPTDVTSTSENKAIVIVLTPKQENAQ